MLPGTSHEPQLCTESQVIQSLEKPTTNGYQWTVQPSEAGDLYHLISSEAGDFGIHGKCAFLKSTETRQGTLFLKDGGHLFKVLFPPPEVGG